MTSRVTDGLLFEYDLRRADCLNGAFPPSAGADTFGELLKLTDGISCLDGVGVEAAAERPAAALVSQLNATAVMSQVSSSFTVELWVKPSAADIANTNARLPILALGASGVAETGLTADDCTHAPNKYALLVAQHGANLEFELLENVNTKSASLLDCPKARAFGGGAAGEIFTSADALYHVVLSVAPGAQLAVYVDGVPLTDAACPASRVLGAGCLGIPPIFFPPHPVDVDWTLWPDTHRLVVAPKEVGLSGGSWGGRLHLLAAYARALGDAEVAANHAAWLVDSAPLTPDAVVIGAEDTP